MKWRKLSLRMTEIYKPTFARTSANLDAQKNFYLDTPCRGETPPKLLFGSILNLKEKRLIKALDRHGNYYDTTMYYLILQEGNGTQATVADRSFVLYKGQTLKGKVFDQAMTLRTNTWFDLIRDSGEMLIWEGLL